ncbi:MAG: hypothetical protein ACOC8D_02120, partial [bacterium]
MRRGWLAFGVLLAWAATAQAGAASLLGVTPGRTRRAEAHRLLGEPIRGRGSAVEAFRPRDKALKEARLHYDRQGVVRRARFDPAAELTLELATLLFERRGKLRRAEGHPFDPSVRGGAAASYQASGIHFYLRDGVVQEIWLAAPGDSGRLSEGAGAPSVPSPRAGPVGGLVLPAGKPKAPPRPEAGETPRPDAQLPSLPPALARIRPGRASPGGRRVPPAFGGLTAGGATRDEVRSVLGSPQHVRRWGADGFEAEYGGGAEGVRRVVVRFGRDGVAAHIEARLGEPLRRAQVAAALGLGLPAARLSFEGAAVELYPAAGVELAVRQGRVTGLRLAQVAVPEAQGPAGEAAAPTAEQGEEPPALRQAQHRAGRVAEFLGAQRVQVRRVWYKGDVRAGRYRGLMVFADLAARGCKSKTMQAFVRLRTVDGAPVMATKDAPGRFVDDRRRFVAPAPDEVLHDPARWEAYQVFVPYAYLDLAGGRKHRVVLVFTATCDGQTNGLEALCT